MTSSGYDGPEAITADQLRAVIALADHVFGLDKTAASLGDYYPMLFSSDHLDSVRVFMSAGRPVSIVAMVVHDFVIWGCSSRIGCLGAVATDESCRGHGLAGRLVDEAVARARKRGAPVMLISGDLDLYKRRGSVEAGLFHHYTFPVDSLADGAPDVTVAELSPDEVPIAMKMYESEPLHYVNTDRDYGMMAA